MPHPSDRPPTARPEAPTRPDPAAVARPAMSLSMHADVEIWCDCCSCEAEPYWVEAFADDQPDD